MKGRIREPKTASDRGQMSAPTEAEVAVAVVADSLITHPLICRLVCPSVTLRLSSGHETVMGNVSDTKWEAVSTKRKRRHPQQRKHSQM